MIVFGSFLGSFLGSMLACSGAGGDSDVGIVVDAPSTVELNDQDSGMEVTITGGSAPGWRIGGVWTAQSLTDEGCLNEGDVCHTLAATGGFFNIDLCSDSGDVPTDGKSCIPTDGYRLGQMTFVLLPSIGSGCWVWGSEPAYYDALECTTMTWSNESY
jgi:hypothetical protein